MNDNEYTPSYELLEYLIKPYMVLETEHFIEGEDDDDE